MKYAARGDGSSKLESGTRIYGVYGFNEVLSDANAAKVYDMLNARHARTYA